MVDSGTELYEVERLAYFGKVEQVMAHHYGKVYAAMRRLIRLVYDQPGMNLVIIHHLKAQYINDKRTKNYELAGCPKIPPAVQLNLEASWNPDEEQFEMQCVNSRHDSTWNGYWWEGNEMCTFPLIASMVTGTDEEEWL